jgi:VPDSG-CTERM motif
MDVGNWITEPELHAHHPWGARWRLDNFSARLRFTRFGCLAAQVAVAKGGEVMKALPKKLPPLILFVIAVMLLFSVQPAQGFTITMEQVGANVVATGTGAINLTGLTFSGTGSGGAAAVFASSGGISIGATADTNTYKGFTGPTSFGSGGVHFANTSSGDFVTIFASGFFFQDISLPRTYVSNAALSDSMTFNNANFASLGVTPGTYVWTWGTGLPNQNFTLVIPSVPDGGSTVSLLGCALLGLAAFRRKLSC